MEKLFRIVTLIGMMVFAVCLPIVAQETGTEPGTDYDAVFASLAAIVTVIPVVVEGIKALFPKMPCPKQTAVKIPPAWPTSSL